MISREIVQAREEQTLGAPPSDPGYIGLLSDFCINQLRQSPQAVQNVWNALLTQTYRFERTEYFDKEIVSRVHTFSLFEEAISKKLHKICSSSCEIFDIFLRLATTYKSSYYSQNEFFDLVERFLVFQAKHGNQPISVRLSDVPCFDQNGREWLEDAIKNATAQVKEDCRSTVLSKKILQYPKDASPMLAPENRELSVVGYCSVSGKQCLDGVGYTAGQVLGLIFPQIAQ